MAPRKPPRPTSLILGLVLIVAAIWRLQTCAKSPDPDLSRILAPAETATTSSAKP